MKIGIDVRVLLDKHYSGVASFTFYLLKNILKIDKQNAYCFFYNSFRAVNIKGFSVKTKNTRYPNKVFNYFLQKIFNYPKLDRVLDGVDVFYLPHINFASFSPKSKNVITIHDLSFLRYPEFFSWRKNFWHKSLNIKKNIKKFDKIIAVSENTKNDLIELLGVDSSKIEVIYPGISHDLIELSNNNKESSDFINNKNATEFLKDKYNIEKPYILYFGTIEPRKNIKNLISAFNLLRDDGFDYKLVLVGSWGWKTKEIKKKWKESLYKDDILFIGYVNELDKPIFYKNAEFLVYPSFYEGFGFPPLEAMNFSLAVIASNVSSLPEVLSDCAILINPDKENEIFEAMKMLIKDGVLKKRLIEKASLHIKKFNWEDAATKYLKVFSDLSKS